MENIEHKASVVSSINWYHEVYFFLFFIAAFAAFDVFVISGNTIKKILCQYIEHTITWVHFDNINIDEPRAWHI